MESKKILLGKGKNKLSVNEDNNIGVELQSYEKVLPYTDDSYHVDAYLQYFKEKDASEKYRLAFTITPFCTNVLFNVITEPVFKEGSNECIAVTGVSFEDEQEIPGLLYKPSYKINRPNLIRDTGFSHSKVTNSNTPIVYHCGYDIFNNHFLRKKEFNVVNFTSTTYINPNSKECNKFNTIEDYLRSNIGDFEKENILQLKNGNVNTVPTLVHLYQYDTLYSYTDAVFNNLTENNGWFGFLNPTTLAINNYKLGDEWVSINKCMNNNKAWEQYDMYPDRSLFSFVPKINKYRGRAEKNWDYCVTYPKYSDFSHPLVTYTGGNLKVNGLRCKIDANFNADALDNENTLVTFKSFTRHNLAVGGYVILSFIESGSKEKKTAIPAKIISLGKGGYDSEHYFSVRLSSIINEIGGITGTKVSFIKGNSHFEDIRFRKFENGGEAMYYLRVFKKISDGIPNSYNKLSFSQNVYSDQVAQVVYTGDFDTTELTDNLGRKVSELFLTIVKRNKGYKKWYEENIFNEPDIEFSHCFGEVTSGFDFPVDDECKDYNVHRIHSVEDSVARNKGITSSPIKLETELTIEGDTDLSEKFSDTGLFYGDIVEFLPSRMEESVIEDVYHRFNTAQRETRGVPPEETISKSAYRTFTYDEIEHDDYDLEENFGIKTYKISDKECINIVPEGYFYKPHYRVLVKQFEGTVNQGNHIHIACTSIENLGGGKWKLNTSVNYYFEATKYKYVDRKGNTYGTKPEGVETTQEKVADGSKVYIRKFYDGKLTEITGTCIEVAGKYFQEVTIQLSDNTNIKKDKFEIYKENTEKPVGAYELQDGSGRYLWRNVLSYADMTPDDELYEDVFTNGAHYFHKNIMFYLKRQDPNGEYGIGNEPSDTVDFISVDGKVKEISYAEYIKEGMETIC